MGIYDQLGVDQVSGPSVIKLSDKKVQALKPAAKDYRVNADNGLSCLVAPSGKKFWRFRYMWLGREELLSMGEYPYTSPELARKKELGWRPIGTVDAAILLAAVEMIEKRGAETAHRARTLAGKVLRSLDAKLRDWLSIGITDTSVSAELQTLVRDHRPLLNHVRRKILGSHFG